MVPRPRTALILQVTGTQCPSSPLEFSRNCRFTILSLAEFGIVNIFIAYACQCRGRRGRCLADTDLTMVVRLGAARNADS